MKACYIVLHQAHIETKGNEAADKTLNKATEMPGIALTRLTYASYYPIIRKA